MATSAMARQTVFALRQEIARLEGRPPAWLEHPAPAGAAAQSATVLRRAGHAPTPAGAASARLSSGAAGFDGALGGGLPRAALSEICAAATRDAAAAAGFALALAARAAQAPDAALPVLWIGPADLFGEAGAPYAPGLLRLFALPPERLALCTVARRDEALWVAEEAAGAGAFAAVLVELHGRAARLGLTATRRLQRRAAASGRPVLLVRQAAAPEPTAAPLRLAVAPAPSALRATLAGLLPGSIGPPAFAVAIDKSPAARPATFVLHWNPDERAFEERRPEISRPVVPAPAERPHPAPAPGARLARGRALRRAG